ncbi:MAG: sigma-70 family RNA polymerase sigma factor [Proteobacteria bacterium]|nr:sigma-70 family RNA polymerase sigma factor [Pseudomonadota bacterium]
MRDSRVRFEAQVLPHLDAAYRYARWLCGSPSDADDVVQEAVLRAFRGFAGLRGEAKPWLLTIVRNCHATALGQRQRRGFVPLPDEHDAQEGAVLTATAPGPEEVAIGADQGRSLERALAALPEPQREVLVLREIEEMDYRQIAAVTNVPIGTVMSRLARARAALREQWVAVGGDLSDVS